jgi:cystathionine beta-lyase
MAIQYDLDRTVDRAGTYSVKWDCMPEGAPRDALPLWVADMDFPCAQPILEALHARVDRRIFGYTNYEDPQVKGTITGWYRKRFGWEVDAGDIFYSPGVMPAVAFLLDILTKEGDGVVIQRPVYYPFTKKIEMAGRRVVNSPLLYRDGDYTMDFEDLEEKLSRPDTSGMILCSPHNPVGRVWTPEELGRVAELVVRYDKWIISDEIHGDLVRRGVAHHPFTKACPQCRDRAVVCTAPSKTFNLAGMQLSNIVIHNPAWKEAWQKLVMDRYAIMDASPLSLAAMTAAYTQGEEWLEQVLDYVDANVAFARRFLAENLPGARLVEPQGTYLLWVDLRGCCPDPRELRERMLQKARVALDEGYIFGEEGAGFERINAACPRSILEECLRRMARALS